MTAPPKAIESTVLESAEGLRVTILNLGVTVHSIAVPTVNGYGNTVLGFEDFDDYWVDANFVGARLGASPTA